MPERNGLLIAGLYATIGIVVFSIGYGSFSYYQNVSSSRTAQWKAELAAEMAAGRTPVNTRPPRPAVNAAALTRSHAQLTELQAMLERNSRLLDKRTVLLNQKTAECKALQQQLDGSIATVLALLDMDAGENSVEARQALGRSLEQEFKQLSNELERSESLELEQMQQVAQLKSELAATQSEIEAIAEQTDTELLSLFQQQRTLETASRLAFNRLGETAIPVLIELLSDERADVRAWAASVLGDLGPNGQEAVPALLGMLVDNDEAVREQAQDALDRLDN